jgi:aconitate hydratase
MEDLILANHTYNEGQIGWFVAGSALNLIAAKHNFNFNIKNAL